MSHTPKVAVYFVASPLQYLAARRIAEHFEPGARQVLVWYKPGIKSIIKVDEWDACTYMPWPRLEPLPGLFGRHRRLLSNIRMVADLVGSCDTLVVHSAVFDTEAINYFLHALPAAANAREMHARILPDGLISIRRYPLSRAKRVLQHMRKLRGLFAPRLRYQCFSGDRIGSDAPFCDRIYTVANLPCEYPKEKVCVLPPLVDIDPSLREGAVPNERRALVIGQPLTDTGLLSAVDMNAITGQIHDWLVAEGITQVDYKGHPKDPAHELYHPDYHLVDPACALESYMASTPYAAVLGVRSSALLFARQIYPSSVHVVAFGWGKVRFKSKQEQDDMRKAFAASGVEFE